MTKVIRAETINNQAHQRLSAPVIIICINKEQGAVRNYNVKYSSKWEIISTKLQYTQLPLIRPTINVAFVKSFLSGVVDRKAYRQLVANLYFVYSAIEQEMKINEKHSAITPIYFPELNRKASLEEDLQFYYGDNWQEEIQPSPATQIYVERIHTIGKNDPALLVAHAYTRYLGDLSGGQILRKIAENAMNLSNGEGTAFYSFPNIENEQSFKHEYREALDSIPMNEDKMKQIVSEANVAFTLNMKIFQELNSSFIKIMTILLLNTIRNLRNKIMSKS